MPVALNLYKIRNDSGPAGALFRSVQRQKEQYQGIWVVSPEGKVLSGHHGFKAEDEPGRSREVLQAIQDGLAAFGPIQESVLPAVNPLPYRGKGSKPDGSVTLAIYGRYLHDGRPDGPAMIDSLDLSRDEWRSLTTPQTGSWTIPEPVARKLVRLLSPNSDQSTMPQPKDATIWTIECVRDQEPPHAAVLLEGRLEAIHLCEGDPKRPIRSGGHIEGLVQFREGSPVALNLVLTGTYRHSPPYDAPRQFGAVVEWTK